ncbi:MAG: zinc ribbon domain-containing protein [Verrucomicrobiota bacterium]|jgi:hypothetical protein
MLICPKCSYDNELGRIFCHSCGDKLDLSNIKPATPAEKKLRQVKRTATPVIRRSIELAVAGVVLLSIVLVCLVPAIAPVMPTNNELVAADGKQMDLQKLVNSQKSGKLTVTAAELNAFLNQKPFDKPTGSDVSIMPVVRRASLCDGRVKVELLATAHFGTMYDKSLYFAYEGQPMIVAGRFVFKPTGAWLGQLPIHPRLPVLMPLFEQRITSLIQELTGEQALLDKLTAINVAGESVEFIKTAPVAP